MNKLKSNLFIKRPWGGEVVWALTDNYMAKTIDINKNAQTDMIVHSLREKSIVVLQGPLYLIYGEFGSNKLTKSYKLDEGWSWAIESGHVYKYIASQSPVRLIEVSSSELDDGHIIVDDGMIDPISESDFIEPSLKM